MFGAIGIKKTVLDAVVITEAGGSDQHITEIDCSSQLGGVGRELIVSYKVETSSTAPGGSRTFTPNLYWSDERLGASAATLAILAGRKQALTAVSIANSASVTRQNEYTTIIRPRAKYLYVSLDSTVLDAGATVTVTMNFVRLPSTSLAD